MKMLWALRYVFGNLLAFGLVVGLGAWALFNYPGYFGVGLAILLAFIAAIQPRVRRERARLKGLVAAALQEAYAQLSPPPALIESISYGYPSFVIIFRSKSELEAATAENEVFKAAIGIIFKGCGSRSRPFDADLAVSFTCDGSLEARYAREKHP